LENTLRRAKDMLREAGISSWALDADILMTYVLKLRREQLITNNKYLLSCGEEKLFWSFVEKRLNSMPVSYITNTVEFMGLNFYINENVLIPRPDTETLVEAAIAYINKSGSKSVLDMCSGSGAMAVSISHYCPDVKVAAADICSKALTVAKKNAESNKAFIDFIKSDMFENVERTFDVIVSNPPYISRKEMAELHKNVADYEPRLALYGGEDGLDFYKVLSKAGKYLNSEGKIFLEIGSTQKNDITEIFASENFYPVSALKDLAGLDRTLIFGKNID